MVKLILTRYHQLFGSHYQGQIEYEASCYEVNFRRKDFDSAQSQCAEKGGNLVTVNNE